MKLADKNIFCSTFMLHQSTVKNILHVSADILRTKNIPSPRLDVEILLAHVLKTTRTHLFINSAEKIPASKIKNFIKFLQRRISGEPIAYIIKQKEFWSLPLFINKNVLIPRAESELLVEIILELYQDKKNLSLLEIGVGSGAIAIAIAKEKPSWHISATDICKKALYIAKKNSKNLQIKNIKFIQSDLFKKLKQKKFDIIVSNPPYIADNDLAIDKFVRAHEPATALFANDNGMDIIKKIIINAKEYLNGNGMIFLEHGFKQSEKVKKLFIKYNYKNINTKKDLANHIRISYACV